MHAARTNIFMFFWFWRNATLGQKYYYYDDRPIRKSIAEFSIYSFSDEAEFDKTYILKNSLLLTSLTIFCAVIYSILIN